jgi:hypothetical protein
MKQAEILPLAANKGRLLKDYSIVVHGITSQGMPEYFTIKIPAGFEFDGATVPRVLWTVSGITPWGLHQTAAMIHDYIYVNKGEGIVPGLVLTQKFADKLLKYHFKELGYTPVQCHQVYVYCRVFGWLKWDDII